MNAVLPSITAIAVFAIAGCGSNAGSERKTGYAVDELANIAVADKEAFMGKEVIVSGYVANVSPNMNNNGYSLSLDFDLHSPVERQLNCTVPQGKAPGDVRSKWVTVKGTIANIHSQTYMDLKSVWLEQCEITKGE